MQTVTSGVPQGTILGPLLFSIYLNDIWNYEYNCLLIAFADDLKLIGPSGNCFQADINNKFVKHANMKLNCDKCKILHYCKSSKFTQKIIYYINENEITPSISDRVLGVILDVNLDFSEHISKILKTS